MNKTKVVRMLLVFLIIILTIIIYLTSCTIGVSHRVTINEYGDTDTSKTNKKFINNLYYLDTTKHKKNERSN